MLEVALSRTPTMKIGRDTEYPTAFVQQRFEQITSAHIKKVLDGIQENTTRVWNTRAYLLAALFNAPSTMDNHYTMLYGRLQSVDETGGGDLPDGVHTDNAAIFKAFNLPRQYTLRAWHYAGSQRSAENCPAVRSRQLGASQHDERCPCYDHGGQPDALRGKSRR